MKSPIWTSEFRPRTDEHQVLDGETDYGRSWSKHPDFFWYASRPGVGGGGGSHFLYAPVLRTLSPRFGPACVSIPEEQMERGIDAAAPRTAAILSTSARRLHLDIHL